MKRPRFPTQENRTNQQRKASEGNRKVEFDNKNEVQTLLEPKKQSKREQQSGT